MVVGGGTLTAGPSHGGTSNSNNELGDTMSQGHFLNVYAKMTPFIHKMKQYVQYVQYANNIAKYANQYAKEYANQYAK